MIEYIYDDTAFMGGEPIGKIWWSRGEWHWMNFRRMLEGRSLCRDMAFAKARGEV